MQELFLYIFLGACALVMGVFFIFRGIKKFAAWRDGDKDELWTFLALIIGCVLMFILGITLVFPMFLGETLLEEGSPILIILCLIPVGLYTFYYILKWREAK